MAIPGVRTKKIGAPAAAVLVIVAMVGSTNSGIDVLSLHVFVNYHQQRVMFATFDPVCATFSPIEIVQAATSFLFQFVTVH